MNYRLIALALVAGAAPAANAATSDDMKSEGSLGPSVSGLIVPNQPVVKAGGGIDIVPPDMSKVKKPVAIASVNGKGSANQYAHLSTSAGLKDKYVRYMFSDAETFGNRWLAREGLTPQ